MINKLNFGNFNLVGLAKIFIRVCSNHVILKYYLNDPKFWNSNTRKRIMYIFAINMIVANIKHQMIYTG